MNEVRATLNHCIIYQVADHMGRTPEATVHTLEMDG